MREDWKAFLSSAGANIEGNTTVNFGNIVRERRVVQNGSILSDLSNLGLIAAYGPDARQFLQNQLTNDISLVSESQSQLNGYCNPKGRLFTLFDVFQRGDTFYLQLARELIDPLLKRLRMYVLNSKVTLEDASDSLVRIGYASPKATQELNDIFTDIPSEDYACFTNDDCSLIKLPSPSIDRYEIVGETGAMKKIWEHLDVHATPVGYSSWELLNILSGQPEIRPETSEEFVPQMINLDVIQGVSFKKGCYPGQEIVARVHYLGKIKRRMFLAYSEADTPPKLGAPLFRQNDKAAAATGHVVSSAIGPDQGSYLLCVLETAHADQATFLDEELRLPIKLMDLPYKVEI